MTGPKFVRAGDDCHVARDADGRFVAGDAYGDGIAQGAGAQQWIVCRVALAGAFGLRSPWRSLKRVKS